MNSKNTITNVLSLALLIVFAGLVSPLSLAQESAGKTIMARGDVNATNDNSGERALRRRSPVYTIDNVKTGAISATQLRMIDGGLLALQEESELAIDTYAFNQNDNSGSVSMDLIKGGLRTITGQLQTDKDNYKLNTPVASIGVRGTHYEAEMFEGDLYLAGWEGIIDVIVKVSKRQFSLGPNEDYRFAIVRSDGSVEFLVNEPPQFSDGHSSNLLASNVMSQTPIQFSIFSIGNKYDDLTISDTLVVDLIGEPFIDNDNLVARLIPESLLVSRRTGNVTFDFLEEYDFTSNIGNVSDINMSITVDFDKATIPTGNLSFFDGEGEWFAAFNGLINQTSLDVNINFASYNNSLADGSLDAIFIDGATGILGNVNLFELERPDIRAGGSFLLRERNQ